MTSYEARTILEPIDPLNISFSEDKCVKTPETLNSNEKEVPNFPKVLIKEPKDLFGIEATEVCTSPRKRASLHKTYTPPSTRYTEAYKSFRRSPQIELQSYERRFSSYKKAGCSRNIGKIGTGEHIMEIKKLDSLIKRINTRIEATQKYCR